MSSTSYPCLHLSFLVIWRTRCQPVESQLPGAWSTSQKCAPSHIASILTSAWPGHVNTLTLVPFGLNNDFAMRWPDVLRTQPFLNEFAPHVSKCAATFGTTGAVQHRVPRHCQYSLRSLAELWQDVCRRHWRSFFSSPRTVAPGFLREIQSTVTLVLHCVWQ